MHPLDPGGVCVRQRARASTHCGLYPRSEQEIRDTVCRSQLPPQKLPGETEHVCRTLAETLTLPQRLINPFPPARRAVQRFVVRCAVSERARPGRRREPATGGSPAMAVHNAVALGSDCSGNAVMSGGSEAASVESSATSFSCSAAFGVRSEAGVWRADALYAEDLPESSFAFAFLVSPTMPTALVQGHSAQPANCDGSVLTFTCVTSPSQRWLLLRSAGQVVMSKHCFDLDKQGIWRCSLSSELTLLACCQVTAGTRRFDGNLDPSQHRCAELIDVLD